MGYEDLLDSLLNLGLFDEPQEMIMYTDEPKTPGYLTLPNEKALARYNCTEVYGQGFHTDKTMAKIKSIGEYLERLCIFNPQEDKLVVSCDNDSVDIAIFVCYSSSQLGNNTEHRSKLRRERYRMWPVIDYFENIKLHLPAQLIFLSDIFHDESPIRKEQITTGAAFGTTGTDEAFIRGFLEVVERDACMISYLKKRKLSEIVGFPDSVQRLLEYLQRYRLEPHVYDATTDLEIPTIITVSLDRTGLGPSVNTGAKSDFDYERAVIGSILESIQCRRTTRFAVESQLLYAFPTETEITSMDQRYFYWYNPKRIYDLDFWLNSPPRIDFSELIERNSSLEKAMHKLKSRNYHVFSADITLPEIRQHGFEVVKVLIPELHPLYLDEGCKALYSIHAGEIQEDYLLKPHPFS